MNGDCFGMSGKKTTPIQAHPSRDCGRWLDGCISDKRLLRSVTGRLESIDGLSRGSMTLWNTTGLYNSRVN